MAVIIEHDSIVDMPRSANGKANPVEYAKCIYNLFSAHDNRFSYTEGDDYIVVNNIFKVYFIKSGWDQMGWKIVDLNENTLCQYRTNGMGGTNNNPTFNADIISSPGLFYAMIYSANGNGQGTLFFWHTKNNKNFIGIPGDGGGPLSVPIENTVISCIEESNTTFKIPTPTIYGLESPRLLFSDIQFVYGNTGTYSIIDELKVCSYVQYRSTVSTGGKNYYAIGNNTLIEVTTS